MNTSERPNRVAVAFASAIMLVLPLTIGYYLVALGFLWWNLPAIYLLMLGFVIAVGGSALLALCVYQLIVRFAKRKRFFK